MKPFFTLTKFGIIVFALASTLAGYAISIEVGRPIDWNEVLMLLGGMYLVCAGSFAINQAQEWRLDAKMPRTQTRPIPKGLIKPWEAYLLGSVFILVGLSALYLVRPLTAGLSLLTLVLYNGIYTLVWKRYWTFGAVPGAIPGAMPVVIGYSVHSHSLWTPECMYLFLIMFLWQMPHFWCLAIRFREDYRQGGFPVLPLAIGVPRTLYHIGLYSFTYAALAIASPWFLRAHVLYLILVLPLALKVIWEFIKYFRSNGESNWLPFFLWVNLSMLVFLGVPVFDKWIAILWV